MNDRLTTRDKQRIGGVTAALLLLLLAGWWAIGFSVVGVVVVLSISLLLAVQVQSHRHLEKIHAQVERNIERKFEQIEALLGIYFSVSGTAESLPRTGGMAASPDFLGLLYNTVRKQRPRIILELGSGSSTVVGGYALRKNNCGRLISLDHLEKYADRTRKKIAFHGLEDRCSVLHAPLREYSLNGMSWLWYDVEQLDSDDEIDLVIVDGPPGWIQELSRYPALPLLVDRLGVGAAILIDDADRDEEAAVVQRWLDEYAFLSHEYFDVEKGAYVLRT